MLLSWVSLSLLFLLLLILHHACGRAKSALDGRALATLAFTTFLSDDALEFGLVTSVASPAILYPGRIYVNHRSRGGAVETLCQPVPVCCAPT